MRRGYYPPVTGTFVLAGGGWARWEAVLERCKPGKNHWPLGST